MSEKIETSVEKIDYVPNGYRIFVKTESGVKFCMGIRVPIPTGPNDAQIRGIWASNQKDFVIEAEIIEMEIVNKQ